MTELIIGGSGSGKSEYAENEAVKISGEHLIYLATMENHGAEAERRIKKHRKNRDGKGFFTVELPLNVGTLSDRMLNGEIRAEAGKSTVLLEALSSLLANEMFSAEARSDSDQGKKDRNALTKYVCNKILYDIRALSSGVKDLIIVSDDVFRDGRAYGGFTEEYMRALGFLHSEIAAFSDRVIEMVSGNAVIWKDRKALPGEDLGNKLHGPEKGV